MHATCTRRAVIHLQWTGTLNHVWSTIGGNKRALLQFVYFLTWGPVFFFASFMYNTDILSLGRPHLHKVGFLANWCKSGAYNLAAAHSGKFSKTIKTNSFWLSCFAGVEVKSEQVALDWCIRAFEIKPAACSCWKLGCWEKWWSVDQNGWVALK